MSWENRAKVPSDCVSVNASITVIAVSGESLETAPNIFDELTLLKPRGCDIERDPNAILAVLDGVVEVKGASFGAEDMDAVIEPNG